MADQPCADCSYVARKWLLRALDAEDELDSLRQRLRVLEERLLIFSKAGHDPVIVKRAEVDEALLREVLDKGGRHSLVPRELLIRIDAQLRAAAIFRRDGL